MTDEELINGLRDVDHLSVEDCFVQSPLYTRAADRIEALVKQCEGLAQAAMNNGQALILAEARLAKAVEALRAWKGAGSDNEYYRAVQLRNTVLAEIGGEG